MLLAIYNDDDSSQIILLTLISRFYLTIEGYEVLIIMFDIFFFKTSIRAIDITEIKKAVMNIILYDSKEGNERLEPFIDI